MSRDLIDELALAIWVDREMKFPERVRRMKPDAWDKRSGAYDMVFNDAKERAERMMPGVFKVPKQ